MDDGVVGRVGGVCLYVRCVGGREDVFIDERFK